MTVSVDGLRRNLARAYEKTIEGFREVTEGRDLDDFETLKDGLDDLRQMIGALFCIYSPNPDDLMTDMADESDKLPYAEPKDAQPKDAQPEDAQPEDAQPEDAQPEDAQPEDAQPEDAQPEDD